MYILYRSKIEFDEIEYQISLFIRSVKRIILVQYYLIIKTSQIMYEYVLTN